MIKRIIVVAPTRQRAEDWARLHGVGSDDFRYVDETNSYQLRGTEQGLAVVLADSNRRQGYDEVIATLLNRRYSVAYERNTL